MVPPNGAFRARIARKASQGLKTVAEIAGDNEIHVSQVSAWKEELEANMALLFERTNAVDDARDSLERKCAILERKVGQLVIEKEYLEKSASSWGSINEPYRQKQFPISRQAMRTALAEAAKSGWRDAIGETRKRTIKGAHGAKSAGIGHNIHRLVCGQQLAL